MNSVKAPIVKIGNSRGIRLPKLLIEQLGLGDKVEIEVQRDALIIRSSARPRDGWADQFRRMADHSDDRLLDEPLPTAWEVSQWEW